MFSAISFTLRYHLNLDCMEMDARRQPIDQPTPALLINGVLAILRSQGFAWADIAVNEFAAQLSAAAGLPQTQVKVMCALVYLPRARISAQLSFFLQRCSVLPKLLI